ncbi:hypothetical protein Pyn_25164 [Prunus yedoensis var. nudiflora]|uniref:Transmembrane protein n=1 Tax=Prunus yedoensis var. nudiflora TaxID=2094558 RepID=A0A314V246_PRUYE|nr:hypothetical protein Pyn_25164 [Prunus yedoensis var. nudiflora]
MSIVGGTDGVWDALKVQIALIAWIMVALLLLGAAWVTCSPPFSVGYWFLFGGCRLAMVVRLVAEGLCGTYLLSVLGFPNVVLCLVGFCLVWAFCRYVGSWPLCVLYAFW